MGSRMTWPQIRKSDKYRGRWVALDECRYDGRSAQPVEGSVIDADDDLVELCGRIQDGDNRHCAILFCDEEAVELLASPSPPPPPSVPPPAPPGPPYRAYTH
jgi:hypothetical protein